MNLGWLCMSWRQPETASRPAAATRSHTTRSCAARLIGHLRNLLGMEALQQLPRIGNAESWVLRLNAEEETVAAGAHEVGRVEDRMIRLGQPVEREHAEDRRQRGPQHRAFEGHGN